MTLLHILTLAMVQGITEFLPISSSGHLVLAPVVLGTADQGRATDIAVHVGTLVAVMVYFRADVAAMLRGVAALARGRLDADGARLTLQVCLATVPVVVAGGLMFFIDREALRSVEVIAWATIGFGVLLHVADRIGGHRLDLAAMRLGPAFTIGLAQVLALIPGTSRSGITMTAARALGFDRPTAARFSMLLSIPAILAAGGALALDVVASGEPLLTRDAVLAAALSAVAAFVAIALLMRWLERAGFLPFVIYRLVLGAGLLAWAYL